MLRIKFRDLLHIVRRRILGSSVAPYRRKYDAVKIKYFALLVARLVAAGDRKTGNNRITRKSRIRIAVALNPVLIIAACVQEVLDRAILKFFCGLGRTHVVQICLQLGFIISETVIRTLVVSLDCTDQICNCSGFFIEIVVFNMLAIVD